MVCSQCSGRTVHRWSYETLHSSVTDQGQTFATGMTRSYGYLSCHPTRWKSLLAAKRDSDLAYSITGHRQTGRISCPASTDSRGSACSPSALRIEARVSARQETSHHGSQARLQPSMRCLARWERAPTARCTKPAPANLGRDCWLSRPSRLERHGWPLLFSSCASQSAVHLPRSDPAPCSGR